MIEQFLEWLNLIGLVGLWITMFLEGSSLPFPGLMMVLSYGYLLSPTYIDTIYIAAGMSLMYCIASMIPYMLAYKLDVYLPKRLKHKLQKGTAFFNKYGIWSIALSRPFGIGNYISYVAGLSKVRFAKYFLLTFIGIYPWSYIMIQVGKYFKGNYEVFMEFISDYRYSIYGIVACVCIFFVIILIRKTKMKEYGSEKVEESK